MDNDVFYRIKFDYNYLLHFFVPIIGYTIGSLVYRLLNKKPLKTIWSSMLILFLGVLFFIFAISLTKYKVNRRNITIYYCGFIRQTIPISTITGVSKTEEGYFLFAPTNIKVRIDTTEVSPITNKNYIYCSPKNMDLFIQHIQRELGTNE